VAPLLVKPSSRTNRGKPPQVASLLHPGRPRPLTALLQMPMTGMRGKFFA
jgi:hypothetical protein